MRWLIPKISVSNWVLPIFVLMVFVVPLNVFTALFVSALFHEISHLIALRMCNVRVYSVVVHPLGAEIVTEGMPYSKELICAFAGPIGSLMLTTFREFLPLVAVVAFFQGLFNLLPLAEFDGGRVLYSVLNLLLPPNRAEKLFLMIQKTIWITLLILSIFVFVKYLNLRKMIMLLWVVIIVKKPCKANSKRVQCG